MYTGEIHEQFNDVYFGKCYNLLAIITNLVTTLVTYLCTSSGERERERERERGRERESMCVFVSILHV